MKVVDLDPAYVDEYLVCLEDWSPEMKEAGDRKRQWYQRFKDQGLRVKLAVDDKGTVGGMIQYLPIEKSFADGEGLYMILCIWVHGYKEGRGDYRKKGMGSALIKAAEEDARALGAKGIAAWGISMPFWMKASWFKKYGFEVADKNGMIVLLWKPFAEDAKKPKWIPEAFDVPLAPGKVNVTAFTNGWCPASNIVYERAKRASKEFGDKVNFVEIDTSDKSVVCKCGHSDAFFIDGKQVRTGPPPTYEKIRKMIEKKAKKIK
ncbi:MAG: GNAT family N-acetyltransferase [Methanobacteriota archaeon]